MSVRERQREPERARESQRGEYFYLCTHFIKIKFINLEKKRRDRLPNLTRDGSEFSRREVQESIFSKISLSDSDMSGPEWFPNLCLEITEQDVLLMFVSVSLPAGNKRHIQWDKLGEVYKFTFDLQVCGQAVGKPLKDGRSQGTTVSISKPEGERERSRVPPTGGRLSWVVRAFREGLYDLHLRKAISWFKPTGIQRGRKSADRDHLASL